MENVVIIGGGPSGLAAAIYNARAFLKPLVIAGSPPGGQLMLTTDVENYPGFTSILGPELIQNMRNHAEHFGTRFKNENVATVDFSDPNKLTLNLTNGETIISKSVLIGTGASAQWLNTESEIRLRGKGVSACATCDGFFFKNKVVAIVGGGDTAMEEAMTLTKFASHVYVLHRREEFRASKIMQQRVLDNEKITVLWGTSVKEVLGDKNVEGVSLEFNTDKSKGHKDLVNGNELKLGGLFIAIGHKPNTDFLKDSGVMMKENGYLVTAAIYAWEKQRNPEYTAIGEPSFDFSYQHATNKTGVFAAGDVVDYIYRQGVTAAGKGVEAALEVEKYLEALGE